MKIAKPILIVIASLTYGILAHAWACEPLSMVLHSGLKPITKDWMATTLENTYPRSIVSPRNVEAQNPDDLQTFWTAREVSARTRVAIGIPCFVILLLVVTQRRKASDNKQVDAVSP